MIRIRFGSHRPFVSRTASSRRSRIGQGIFSISFRPPVTAWSSDTMDRHRRPSPPDPTDQAVEGAGEAGHSPRPRLSRPDGKVAVGDAPALPGKGLDGA